MISNCKMINYEPNKKFFFQNSKQGVFLYILGFVFGVYFFENV